jgi:circadian clock protein KaiB
MSSNTPHSSAQHHFTLYIDSEKPKSLHVADRLQDLCKLHLIEDFTLDVIDLRQNPALMEEKNIIAIPTLDVTVLGTRKHRFVGDLSQSTMFIMTLGMGQVAVQMGKEANRIRKEAEDMRNKLKKRNKQDTDTA